MTDQTKRQLLRGNASLSNMLSVKQLSPLLMETRERWTGREKIETKIVQEKPLFSAITEKFLLNIFQINLTGAFQFSAKM